jgi:high affinity Mn2+ porin
MISFAGWRQAFESAVMAGSDNKGRTGNVRTVNRKRRSLEHALAGAAFGALALGSPAMAADMPLKALHLRPAFDWSGFYIGGHTGYGRGSSTAVLSDPLAVSTNSVFSGVIGGVQGGYNVQLPAGLLLGVEADLTFPNYFISNKIVSTLTGARSEVVEALDYAGTVRGRIGYASGYWLVYATGGFAFAGERFINTPDVGSDQKHINVRPGWAAGAGVEYAFAPHWSVKLEYLYSQFDRANIRFPSGAEHNSTLDFQQIRIGLNRKVDWPGSNSRTPKSDLTDPDSDRWEIHGQSTYLGQGYPAFRAPYTGTNSLTPARQAQATWSNFPYPHYNTSRLYVRQTFGFGGEQEELASGQQQLAGKADVNRLTLQAGKFSVGDVFDGNAYAKDTRRDFMNWSIWAPGAFDYAADKLGLTYGMTAELNQKNWALRGGYFMIGAVSNSNNFDTQVFRRGQYVAELETRYSLFSRPGKLRTIGWVSSANSGSYRDTLDNPALNLDIEQTRTGRLKYGYVFNVEQSVTDDIGLFGRWSWNNGKTEIMSFTDIDASLSLGTSIKGAKWGRPDDTIGIAGAINALSRDHRDFLAAGGLGPLIGDGQLNYRKERILETYYAFAFTKQITLTADYQFITNPAFNADRGPVHVFSGRLHGEF